MFLFLHCYAVNDPDELNLEVFLLEKFEKFVINYALGVNLN